MDFIDPRGTEYDKVWLDHWAPYNNAFTIAENELKATFQVHRARFLKQTKA